MSGIQMDSSSEDENDIYVNSVARLKALQNKVWKSKSWKYRSHMDQHDELQNSNKENRKKERRKPRNVQTYYFTHGTNKDAETVSVEDLDVISEQKENNKYAKVRKNIKTTSDDIVILDCNSDEDIEKDENFDVNVKILWQSRTIHRLNIYNHDNFRKVFQYFANMENVSIEQILIMKKEKRINLTDTPSSIGLSIIDILEGGIVDADMISQNEYKNRKNSIEENICQIKVQTANKESLMVPLKKNQQFKILIASCARQWGVNKSNIKLYFDGEAINASDTPESLDLEQEACIDLCISTK
ncbi:uncharacterized protein CG4449 [Vespula pensylvanica]|uniref:uncharacterized protein CG4449 n=1 Tax=Vespula pensylvanica TaxID=30213 RepID=UPI001CBA34C8|nr:uncharacterized protein CG4449 [Vespula pensylvanica]XP_043685719.1 uncharacterized protein CG4449 [Vespula pensylvanica]